MSRRERESRVNSRAALKAVVALLENEDFEILAPRAELRTTSVKPSIPDRSVLPEFPSASSEDILDRRMYQFRRYVELNMSGNLPPMWEAYGKRHWTEIAPLVPQFKREIMLERVKSLV